MAESLKSKRVKFKKGKQKEFIINSKKELGLTWQEFGKLISVSSRNLVDWKNEKFLMSLGALQIICKERKCKFPKDISIRDKYWYAGKGAVSGGKATYEKYHKIGGDEEKRKANWREWWDKEGRFIKHKILEPLPFKKPKMSKELAEFVGIMLGDGGMNNMQITITLHRITDKDYSLFVKKLIEELFNIKPGTYTKAKYLADRIVISRTGLVKYLIENVGLKKGNKIKNQIDIPLWIKEKRSFQIACLRGLIDTDGSVYNHVYRSKGKTYSYKKLQFTSMSKSLANSVYEILKSFGFNPGIHKERDVKLESRKDVEQYFKIVGTNNPKHLNRYKNSK